VTNMARFPAAILLSLIFLTCGCVYKLSVFQGNPITPEDVAKVETGMNRSQVQFLLGTPMIEDPFHNERWDYVYYFRDGKTGAEFKRRFEVYFDGDVVSRVNDLSS